VRDKVERVELVSAVNDRVAGRRVGGLELERQCSQAARTRSYTAPIIANHQSDILLDIEAISSN